MMVKKAKKISYFNKLLHVAQFIYFFLLLNFIEVLEVRKPLFNLSEQQFTEWIKDRIKSSKLSDNSYFLWLMEEKFVYLLFVPFLESVNINSTWHQIHWILQQFMEIG